MTDQTKQFQTINFSSNITIATLNVNGLHDNGKRQRIFQTIQNKKSHRSLLQENHSKPEQATKQEKEWEGPFYWHSGQIPKSLGVAIIFKKDLQVEPLQVDKDQEGRILTLSFVYEKQVFQITIYMHPQTKK